MKTWFLSCFIKNGVTPLCITLKHFESLILCIQYHNKANLRDLIAVNVLVILPKLDPNHQLFGQCDIEIWRIPPKPIGNLFLATSRRTVSAYSIWTVHQQPQPPPLCPLATEAQGEADHPAGITTSVDSHKKVEISDSELESIMSTINQGQFSVPSQSISIPQN